MANPTPAITAASPPALAAAAAIGVTISSLTLLVFGAAIGLSCERWATGKDHCRDSWLMGLGIATGGGLGLAGTWLRNPYLRKQEDDLLAVVEVPLATVAPVAPPLDSSPVDPIDFYVPADVPPVPDWAALDALREDMETSRQEMATHFASELAATVKEVHDLVAAIKRSPTGRPKKVVAESPKEGEVDVC